MKVMNQSHPDDTQVRLTVKSKDEFEDVHKYLLEDPKKHKYYNQYKQGKELRALTKNKFLDDAKVQTLIKKR